MNTHVKLVAILHLALGALGLIGAMVTFTIIGLPSGLALWNGDAAAATVIGIVALCIGGLIFSPCRAVAAICDLDRAFAIDAGR